jgi:transmembrane sensor
MKTDRDISSASGWVARLGDGPPLTAEENAALTDFLRESPVHVRELIEHTFVREDLASLPISAEQLDHWVSEARQPASQPIVFPARTGSQDRPAPGAPRRSPRFLLLAAASLFAFLAAGGTLFYLLRGLYSTGFGEIRTLVLSDGSVVTLNTESQIRVHFSAQDRSITLLGGEALFRVAHDTGRPFLVNVSGGVVRAVGTQFNIRMAQQGAVVSVLDGVVRVTSEAAPVTLSRGEEVRIASLRDPARHAHVSVSRIESGAALHAASWTQGRIEFEDTPLTQIVAEFQRYQHLSVEVDGDATRQIRLTGTFDAHDPDSAMDYIATIPGVAVDRLGPQAYRIRRR